MTDREERCREEAGEEEEERQEEPLEQQARARCKDSREPRPGTSHFSTDNLGKGTEDSSRRGTR